MMPHTAGTRSSPDSSSATWTPSFLNPNIAKYNLPSSPSHTSLHSYFSTHPVHTMRPLPFFHPTRAEFIRHPSRHDQPRYTAVPSTRWSSRASRKNRYSPGVMNIRKSREITDEKRTPSISSLTLVEQRVRHPQTKLKVHLTWDVSFWVALTLVLGSSAWVSDYNSYRGCLVSF